MTQAIEQRSAAWFQARQGKITGSRIGALLGNNQYKTRDELMREMVREQFGAEREFQGNDATMHGELMEPHAIKAYESRTGRRVDAVGFIPHREHLFIGVSPDGLIGNDGGIEVKCPYYARNPYSVFEPSKRSYYDQMQLILHVCDLRWMDYFCFKGRSQRDQKLETVYPEADWWADALPKMEAFHADFLRIVGDPELYQSYLDPIPGKAPMAQSADARLEELSQLYTFIQSVKATLEDRVTRFDALKKDLGAELGPVEGFGIRLKATPRIGQVDHKAVYAACDVEVLLAEKGTNMDAFRRPGTVAYEVEASA